LTDRELFGRRDASCLTFAQRHIQRVGRIPPRGRYDEPHRSPRTPFRRCL